MKKLLALVLALVMSMSLVTISNAAFKDADKIDYKEAVDVMNAVGVFVGDEKGNFNAKENLTREQAAKIIAYLELGSKAADALAGGATFTDVASTRWSAGFVGYCAQAGVVNGVGNSKFDPAGQLTALQFGKMLLVELGYDAKAAGMVGADWAINTSKLMAKAKLMDKIDGSVNQVLTREKAAQMTLNALKAPTVEYTTKGSSISVNGAEINLGASEPTYVTNTIAKQQTISDATLTNNGGYTIELGEKLYTKLKLSSGAMDDFGRPIHIWTNDTKKIGEYAEDEDAKYTDSVKLGTIYADLGLSNSGIPAGNVTYYVDGEKATSTFTNDIVKGSLNEVGGNGALTQVWYDSAKNTATITVINTYFAQIAAAYKASTTKDAYVLLASTGNTGLGSTYETDDAYAVDDYVLYTYSKMTGATGVKSMKLAEKVTGTLTGYVEGKSVVAGGTTYKINAVAASKATIDGSLTNAMNTTVDVYLGFYGDAVYVDAAAASDAYAAVIGSNSASGTGSLLGATKAELLFLDGTRKVVDVKSWGSAQLNDIVSYRINSDKEYILTQVASVNATESAGVLVTKGNTTMDNDKYNLGTAGHSYANGKTTFLIYNEATNTVESYVGIANVPTINLTDADDNCAVYVPNGSASAKVVFVAHDGDAVISGNSKSVFFIKGDKNGNPAVNHTEEFGDYYEYDAIIGGEITKIKMAATAANKITATIASQLTKDSKGVYSLVAGYYANAATPTGATDNSVKYVAADSSHQNDAVVNGTITLAGTPISVADKCEVFVISADGKTISATNVNAIQKDDNDKVWYKTNSDGEVTTIVIQTVDAAGSAGSSSEETYEWEVNANTLRVNLTYSSNTTSVSDVDVMNNAGYALQQAGYVVNAWGGSSSSSIALTTTLTSSGLTAHAYKGNLDITFTVYVARATA